MEMEEYVPPPYKYTEPMETRAKKKISCVTQSHYIKDVSNGGKVSKLKSMLKGYAAATTIHGISYLGEEGRSILER